MTEEEFEGLTEQWHDAPDDGLALHEYMGISWEQYCKHVRGDFDE